MTALFTRPCSVVRVGPWVLPFLAALAVLCLLDGATATAFQDGKSKKKPVPKVYALVHVAREQPRILQEQPARMDREEFADYLDLQVALLKGQLVLKGALAAADVAKLGTVKEQKEPTAWLAGRLQVAADKRTGILRVAVSGGEPEEQALLANAVADAYLFEIVQLETRRKQGRLDQLKKYFVEYDGMLREKRETLRRMSMNLGAVDGKVQEPKRQFARKQLEAVEKELLEVQAQVRKAKIESALIKAWAQANPADSPLSAAAIDQAVRTNPGSARFLENEILQLEAQVATHKTRSPNPEKEPGYQKAVERLEAAKKELGEKLRADLAATQQAAQRRISHLRKVEELLNDEWHDRARAIQGFHKEVVDLEWLQAEIRQLDAVAQQISKQVQLLQIEIQAPPRVTILERAQAPGK